MVRICLVTYAKKINKLFLWPLGPVFASTAFAILHTLCVVHATNNVVSHARKVFHTAAANKHNGVFLQIVAFARNIRNHFHTIRKAHLRDFSKRGVWFLWGCGIHFGTHSAFKWCSTTQVCFFAVQAVVRELQGRRFRLFNLGCSSFFENLVHRRHTDDVDKKTKYKKIERIVRLSAFLRETKSNGAQTLFSRHTTGYSVLYMIVWQYYTGREKRCQVIGAEQRPSKSHKHPIQKTDNRSQNWKKEKDKKDEQDKPVSLKRYLQIAQ